MHSEAMGKAGALLRLAGIHKTYHHGLSSIHALCGIDMQVDAGEMVAVCAPSGHGKTTLLNLIGLLEPPSAGSMTLDGIEVAALQERERLALRARLIGPVFQCFRLLPVLSARDNVMLPLLLLRRLARPDAAEARAYATELLRKVEK